MAKTNYKIIAVYDGDLDATQTFASLIAQKMRIAISQELLATSGQVCYNTDNVPNTNSLASGLSG